MEPEPLLYMRGEIEVTLPAPFKWAVRLIVLNAFFIGLDVFTFLGNGMRGNLWMAALIAACVPVNIWSIHVSMRTIALSIAHEIARQISNLWESWLRFDVVAGQSTGDQAQ
jgi:hypothetical protein